MISRSITKIINPTALGTILTIAKSLSGALIMGAVTAKLIYENQREHDVSGKKVEADCNDIVKDASKFQVVGEPNHGSLTAKVVRDRETGDKYVEKAAHSRKDLVKEFMYANFLHAVRNDQPECLILQKEDKSGAHFHTLSRKYPNSQDIENFIRSGRIDELRNKKVTGLEASLAADQVVGKQWDTKLANLIIRETDDEFKIGTIDNERGVCPDGGFFNIGRVRFPTYPSVLVDGICDLGTPSDDNTSGLAGDARAKEFGDIAINLMTSQKIKDYYTDVAQADINPLIQDCYRLAAHSTLFKAKECAQYQEHFRKIQTSAATYAKEQI